MLDLVIIGGGPSGISTALHVLAARPRTRLVVLEKARYPREKVCAGGIGARAFRILDALGVAIDVPRARIDALALRVRGETIEIRQPELAVVVRRIQFDHAFAEAARARGVDVRDGCGVDAIAIDDHGVRVTTADGDELRAKAIVGADGITGIARRAIGLPRGELRAQVVELDTPGVAQDLARDTIVFDFDTRDLAGYAWDFPTIVDGAPLQCRGVYCLHDHKRALDDPQARMATYLAARGLAIGDYKVKRLAERGLVPGEPIAARRAILVGEAAGIDIATGEGIGQAIEYGAVAGPYLATALDDDQLGFADWRAAIDRHHLGIQMRVRHACYRALYGVHRDIVERSIPRITGLLEVGIQDFAGLPIDKLALARGAMQWVASVVRDVV
ncbi:MAG: NAD(P)/FAD-dependent oxidoreductase [Proteobacteria bacterium]|nr:NAD(P)/FAD-dependent oxidoreductase [Pseudomonadota bacterium]